MKIPPEHTENQSASSNENIYNSNFSTFPYANPNVSEYNRLDNDDAPVRDGDFSEYMWMENEEEYDQQVMAELEEAELVQNCLQAMLEDELEEQQMRNIAPSDLISSNRWSTKDNEESLDYINETASESIRILNINQDVGQGSNLAESSKLNPFAAEFVPGCSLNCSPVSSTATLLEVSEDTLSKV